MNARRQASSVGADDASGAREERSAAGGRGAGDDRPAESVDAARGKRLVAEVPSASDKRLAADAAGASNQQLTANMAGARNDRWDVLQALMTLLPAAALAWPGPGAFLADDLAPQYAGAGIVALASLPAALTLALRPVRRGVRGLVLFLLPILSAAAWIGSERATDSFEATRTLMLWCSGLVLLLSGASLSPRGRSVLAHGVVVIGLVLLACAAFDRAAEHAGVLGNTGSLSEAALPGALLGAGLMLRARPLWMIVAGMTLAGLLVYAALAPVLAGLLSLAAALALGAALHGGLGRRGRAGFALLALVALAGAALPIVRGAADASEAATGAIKVGWSQPTNMAPSVRSDTGGVEVRSRILRASLRLLTDHPWVGVGPGQFAATFPPYRDPLEIELSTHGRKLAGETEVEHPHDDWVAPMIDAGVPIGLAWIAFLAGVVVCAVRVLRSGERIDATLALAALGLLVNALADATLTFNPASSSLAFAVFGCVLARETPARAAFTRRMVAVLAALLLAAHAPRAIAMVNHGRALAALARLGDPASPRSAELLEDALAAAPDSVLAATLAARTSELQHHDAEEVRARWQGVLAERPRRIEALIQLGYLAATSGERSEARPYFERALALDPNHPGALQNLMSLEFEDGNVERALAYLDRRQASHPIEHAWLREYAARLYLRGLERESEALFARVEPELAGLTAEAAYAAAHDFREKGLAVLGDAFESRARRLWARDHAENGRPQFAAASYRQDLRITRDYAEGGAPRVRLELAAALCLIDKEDEAREVMTGLVPAEAEWAALPSWASEALRGREWIRR